MAAAPAWARYQSYRPLYVYGHHHYRGGFASARRLILSRNLLTPAQLSCAEILHGNKAAGEVTQVRVVRRPGPCRADDGGSPFLFDLYIDHASGSYQWTPEDAADLEEAPYLRDARHERDLRREGEDD